MLRKVFFIYPAFLILSFLQIAFSQKNKLIGFSVREEKSSSTNVSTSIGAAFEEILNHHNSLEVEINYRNSVDNNLVIYFPAGANSSISEQFSIRQNFLSIPLLYTYRSKIINFSVGPTLDIFIGWKQITHTTSPPATYVTTLQSYPFDNKFLFGAVIKASKPINLNTKFLLEPCVFFNPILTKYKIYSNYISENRNYFGAALTAKYFF